MSNYYDVKMSQADRDSVTQMRKALTDFELAIQGPRGEFDFVPDFIIVQQCCLRIMMQAGGIIERHEGIDFAPSLLAVPGPTLNA